MGLRGRAEDCGALETSPQQYLSAMGSTEDRQQNFLSETRDRVGSSKEVKAGPHLGTSAPTSPPFPSFLCLSTSSEHHSFLICWAQGQGLLDSSSFPPSHPHGLPALGRFQGESQ